MRNISFYITLFFCLTFLHSKSQTGLYSNILLNTVADSYTVTAVNDTTFAREVIISILDSANIQSLNVSLSIKIGTGWQTVQTTILIASDIATTSCQQPLCLYRRDSNNWVLFLGNYPLYTTHLVELQFNLVHGNSVTDNWSNEF